MRKELKIVVEEAFKIEDPRGTGRKLRAVRVFLMSVAGFVLGQAFFGWLMQSPIDWRMALITALGGGGAVGGAYHIIPKPIMDGVVRMHEQTTTTMTTSNTGERPAYIAPRDINEEQQP